MNVRAIFLSIVLLLSVNTTVFGEEPNLSSQQAPASIDVVIKVAETASAAEILGILHVTPRGCAVDTADVIEVSFQKRWTKKLSLDADCKWDLKAKFPEWWAQEIHIEGAIPDALQILLYPASRVEGSLGISPSEEAPQSIVLQLQKTYEGSSRAPSEPAEFKNSCPVQERTFHCEVPAGVYDVKLIVAGFIPQYHWGVEFKKGKTFTIGLWDLEVGGSIAGWVESTEEPEGLNSHPAITLKRQVSGWLGDPSKRQRMNLGRFETTVNEHGFFQISGVDVGTYHLRIERPGFIPLDIHDLTVEQGQEVVLEDTLVLLLPVELEVVVSPPKQPNGDPWHMRVGLLEHGSMVIKEVISEEVPLLGTWIEKLETSGNHQLVISDGREQIWAERWLDILPGMRPVFVDVPLVEIAGRISMGDEPLETKLVFGSTQGAQQISMSSDELGQFEGFLPKEGLWPIDLVVEDGGIVNQAIAPVTVERKPGKGVVVLDIELPGAKLTGEVLKDGEVVAGARMVIMREENGRRRREGIAAADEEGQFALWGVAPGTLWVHAYLGQLASPWTRIDIVEGIDAPHVRLDMEEKIEVSGFVLSFDGEVPGAQINALPVMQDGSSGLSAEAQTDFDGSFSLNLPRNAAATDLVVSAPGYAQQLLRISLQADQPNHAMIHIERESGELVFRSSEAVIADQHRRVTSTSTLHYNGTAIPLRYLLTRFMSKISIRNGGLGILSMPVGEYRLCNTESSFCEKGYLNPNGELWMNDPPQEAQGSPQG